MSTTKIGLLKELDFVYLRIIGVKGLNKIKWAATVMINDIGSQLINLSSRYHNHDVQKWLTSNFTKISVLVQCAFAHKI